MPYDRFKHHRRSIRLKGYDYAGLGAYYITVYAWGGECLFGEIIDGKMILNKFGRIVYGKWANTPEKRNNVILDVFVVMPNHLHGIFIIAENLGRMRTNCKPGEMRNGDVPRYTGKTYGDEPRCRGVLCRGVLQYAPTHATSPSPEMTTGGLRSPSQKKIKFPQSPKPAPTLISHQNILFEDIAKLVLLIIIIIIYKICLFGFSNNLLFELVSKTSPLHNVAPLF